MGQDLHDLDPLLQLDHSCQKFLWEVGSMIEFESMMT